ncbi:class I SAM-dependent methyltransferase [Arthrobacter sulfonylureivorans]|uniref:Class I SAM-dependent methyltransferase n=1 Tax=Arthrobacter sulfonylureivorans TaxID=2486855 RepID=A0ABY3W4R8_9MICC|nr:class I SAM-dependent methyltransferase [Arthrobacter sulfonylureivorans]UNK45224.1 class I SAM-dependent methyltransferase [Arthrobacter sulfonylureivorans]
MTGHSSPGRAADARTFWDARYGERPRIWSGAVNQVLADTAPGLTPGRALDLGCGEGGDSVWLAECGWQVTGVDVSATALERAGALSESRGLGGEQISWQQIDLAADFPAGEFELVSACFLASPIQLPRAVILQRAAAAVAPGGTLLVVSHAGAPPWAGHSGSHRHFFPTPEEELTALDLSGDMWDIRCAEVRSRKAIGPDGKPGLLEDTVVIARRR